MNSPEVRIDAASHKSRTLYKEQFVRIANHEIPMMTAALWY